MSRQIYIGLFLFFIIFHPVSAQTSPDALLLKDYRPKSIYHVPTTQQRVHNIPVIDMHSHAYANNTSELEAWVKVLHEKQIKKTIILTAATGAKFDSIYNVYSKFNGLFEVWCGFDYTGFGTPSWPASGLKELDRCHMVGAGGVGELGDKGEGETYSQPTKGNGIHVNDPQLQPLLKRCGELKMPVSIHVAEPQWMYEPMDSTNDGLPNAFRWRVIQKGGDFKSHDQLVSTLEAAVKANPQTTFIACHFANCESDLSIIGNLLDKYPNLYADIAARYGETATIPRYMKTFYQKHSHKLIYGTDMGMASSMYNTTFRILESADEHFYEIELFNYHWACYGFDLDEKTLRALYFDNASKILKR